MNRIDEIDTNILVCLLKDHIKSGDYWGNKRLHYKRCQELLIKLRGNWLEYKGFIKD